MFGRTWLGGPVPVERVSTVREISTGPFLQADDDGWVQLVRLDDCLLRWGDIETPSPLGSEESVKQWELLYDRAHERELRLAETRLSRQAAAYRRPITPATEEPAVPARDAVLFQ